MALEQIAFQTDEGEVLFYVLEEARVAGVNYLLVAESDDDDAECLIMKDTSGAEEKEAVYEVVGDEAEQEALLKLFQELMDDAGEE